jgi:hypothetical protein
MGGGVPARHAKEQWSPLCCTDGSLLVPAAMKLATVQRHQAHVKTSGPGLLREQRRRAQQDHHRNNIRIMLFYGFDSSMGRPKPDGSRTAVRHCPSSLPAHPPPSTAAGDAAAPSPPCHAGCPAVAAGAAHDRGKPAGTPDVMPSCPGATGRLMDLT